MLVTGGSRGIGAATVRLAVERGYKVALNYVHNEAAAGKLARETGAIAIPGDVAAERDVVRMFAINITGSFLCAREAVKRMSKKHGGAGGSIINLSSVAARIGAPAMYVDYAASKAAIDTLTLGLSKEVGAEGIRVNAIRPGVIHTDIHASSGDPERADRIGASSPLQRAGEPEEIARAILWLASDEASYVSGAILDVSGGR